MTAKKEKTMKKLFKRTLAMVLTVALCVSTLQLTAFAAELDPVTPNSVIITG